MESRRRKRRCIKFRKILDSNGNELQDGDSVVVIKDLPVKGAPKPVKAGTKVKISV
jgi:uncharacterized Zn ribbon protein